MKMSSREGWASFNSQLYLCGIHAQNLVILSRLLIKGHISAELQLSCVSVELKNQNEENIPACPW